MLKILDCTLRDGGYYTNWDFDKETVNEYIKSINNLPVDYVEIGYRNNPSPYYSGKYAFCPVYELKDIRSKCVKKISVMLDEKNVTPRHVHSLLAPVRDYVNLVRIAIDPKNIERALLLAEGCKNLGFELGFNVMYMSKWKENPHFISLLPQLKGLVDLLCMVDSYGGIMPHEVKDTIALIRSYLQIPLGFHGHNNLQMGLSNALIAIEEKVDFIDTTILGMGRGAGNLNTELLLTVLSHKGLLDVDFNVLETAVSSFTTLHEKYHWGTNLPYMISGANSLPQKDVMEWVSNRRYSFNSIVRALDNKKENIVDNKKFPTYQPQQYESAIIIGGGVGAVTHLDGIMEFARQQPSTVIIHASARNAVYYRDLPDTQYFCLVGSEGKRVLKVFENQNQFNGLCILPPYPRAMGTEVPELVRDRTYELVKIDFTEKYRDSCTAIALQVVIEMGVKKVYLVGYDGYQDIVLSQKERDLTLENEYIFFAFNEKYPFRLVSLTPTLYKISIDSVYQRI